jgi:hypothetical protein
MSALTSKDTDGWETPKAHLKKGSKRVLKRSTEASLLITDQAPDGTSPPASLANVTDQNVAKHAARAKNTYQIIHQIYHYEKTFEIAAACNNLSLEELGTQMAVFAMQAMQGLRVKGIVSDI